MNKSGKTLTIFLSVLSALFLALSGIACYYYLTETKARQTAEINIEKLRDLEAKLQGELKESKKQTYVLEEKNKEADGKINDLMDNLELEKGLREEVKKENLTLKEALENESQSKEKIRTELTVQLSNAQEKITSLQTQLTTAQKQTEELQTQAQNYADQVKQYEVTMQQPVPAVTAQSPAPQEIKDLTTLQKPEEIEREVSLDKIVVGPNPAVDVPALPDGRVLSVDKENEFLIVNLGEKDGLTPGVFLSVYRGNDYLGDVRISRVQPNMSAADFVPPFSSQKVRKNDQVVAKK